MCKNLSRDSRRKREKMVDFVVDIEKNEKIINLRKRVNEFSKDLYFPC